MKKLLVAIIMFAAIFAASCEKENTDGIYQLEVEMPDKTKVVPPGGRD